MNGRPAIKLLAVLLLWCSAATVSAAAERLVLVIGNSHYQQLRTLKNPARDARAVASKLKALGFTLIDQHGRSNQAPVLDLDEDAFISAYLDFARAAKGAEIALVYYAGHGMQIGGHSYLFPVDVPKTRVRLIQRNAVRLEEVLRELDGKAQLTVAVFDACREIPQLEEAITAATRDSGLGASEYRGLARVRSKGRSRLVAFAGAAGQLVKDGEGQHSPYTGLLRQELDKEGAPIEQVFQQVAWRFGQRYGGQNPEVLNQGVRPNHFFLAGAGNGLHDDQGISGNRLATLIVATNPANSNVRILGGPEYFDGVALSPGNYQID